MLGDKEPTEDVASEGEGEGTELEVILDEIEASSNIVISDRKAFGEAMTALIECCSGGEYEGDESEGKGPPALMIALGAKPKHGR